MTGSSFSIDVTGGLAGSVGVALLSTARLDVAVGNGCTVYPQLPGATALRAVSAAGTASLPVAVPNNSALLALALYAQWCVVDPAGAFGPGVGALSDALRVTIGDV